MTRGGLQPVRGMEHGYVRQTRGLRDGEDAGIGPPGYHTPERLPGSGAALLLSPRGQPRVRFGESDRGRTDGGVMMVAFRSMVHPRG